MDDAFLTWPTAGMARGGAAGEPVVPRNGGDSRGAAVRAPRARSVS